MGVTRLLEKSGGKVVAQLFNFDSGIAIVNGEKPLRNIEANESPDDNFLTFNSHVFIPKVGSRFSVKLYYTDSEGVRQSVLVRVKVLGVEKVDSRLTRGRRDYKVITMPYDYIVTAIREKYQI